MNAAAPLVTVVVPAFGGARHLGATLDSLDAQRRRDFEVIVVDDGSVDDTVAVARAHPVGARVIEQRNLGVAVARNRGLAAARGDWVAFLDQDDLWQRDRLGTLLELAERTDAPAVATSESRFALAADRDALAAVGDGRELWPSEWIGVGEESLLIEGEPAGATGEIDEIPLERLLEGAAMLTTVVMYRRDLAIMAGGCAPHARALDDHVLNLNVTRIAGPIRRIDSKQLRYRVHPSSTTTVSPMVGPFLSTQAAFRLGGVFPREVRSGPNVEHLLFGLARAELSTSEQLALLALTAPKGERFRWTRRWLARRLRVR